MGARPFTSATPILARPPAAADGYGSRRLTGVYFGLWVAGTALPLSRFAPWLAEHGLDVPRFVGEVFATPLGAFFGWDVVIAVAALLTLAVADRELPGRQRLAVAGASLLGASCGLPLYLLLRERQRTRPA